MSGTAGSPALPNAGDRPFGACLGDGGRRERFAHGEQQVAPRRYGDHAQRRLCAATRQAGEAPGHAAERQIGAATSRYSGDRSSVGVEAVEALGADASNSRTNLASQRNITTSSRRSASVGGLKARVAAICSRFAEVTSSSPHSPTAITAPATTLVIRSSFARFHEKTTSGSGPDQASRLSEATSADCPE